MTWNYVSGFFDADGSITVSRDSVREQPHVVISFCNNERAVLDEIRIFIFKELKVKGFIIHKKPRKVTHSDNYELCYASTPKCLVIAQHLQSLHPKKMARLKLIPKVKELTPRNGKYSDELLEKRRALIEHFLSL